MRDFAASGEGATHSDPVPSPVLAAIQAHGVAINGVGDVGTYLSVHPELGRQLEWLSRTARQRLGPSTLLTLALVRDPETDDEQLALYARQVSYDPDLLDLLDEVAEGQEDEAGPGTGRVMLTTDFQPPR